jgi:hypothetical protein
MYCGVCNYMRTRNPVEFLISKQVKKHFPTVGASLLSNILLRNTFLFFLYSYLGVYTYVRTRNSVEFLSRSNYGSTFHLLAFPFCQIPYVAKLRY